MCFPEGPDNGDVKFSSPISIYYAHGSHSLMSQCKVRALGNFLALVIQVPESSTLTERHSLMKTVQLFDPEVIIMLAKKWKSPDVRLCVELVMTGTHVAGTHKFRYSVTEMRVADSTIWLDVIENVPKPPASSKSVHQTRPSPDRFPR